jgi:hypothetical protein
MTGLWSTLSDEQKKSALEYDGPENSGNPELEALRVKKTLGIGTPLPERIQKLRDNQFQYCSAGTARLLAERVEKLESRLREIAEFSDATENCGISNTCGRLNKIAREALK